MRGPARHRKRYRLIVLALLTVAAVVLAGCAGGAETETADKGPATSGNITWWGWTPDAGPAQEYIKAFNRVYPNIHVTYKMLTIADYNAALRPALYSSVGPDVFDIAPGAGGANGSVQTFGVDAVNLEPAVEKALGPDWKSKLVPTGVSSLTTDGKLAGLSVGSVYAGTLWIDQNLFDQYRLPTPTTFAQWKNDCAVFKAHNIECFVQGAGQVAFNQDTLQAISDNIQPGVWTLATEGKVPWTNPTIVKTLTIWKQMFTDGIMQDGALGMQQYPDANNAFMSRKAAMIMMGTWYMQYSTKQGAVAAISGAGVANPTPFTQVPIPFPDVAGTGHVGALFGDSDFGLAVNMRSKHINAATTFATWLATSRTGQQEVADILNDIPSLKSVRTNWSAVPLVDPGAQKRILQQLISNANKSTEPRLSLVSTDLQTAIGVASTTVAAGTATPRQAAATLERTSTRHQY